MKQQQKYTKEKEQRNLNLLLLSVYFYFAVCTVKKASKTKTTNEKKIIVSALFSLCRLCLGLLLICDFVCTRSWLLFHLFARILSIIVVIAFLFTEMHVCVAWRADSIRVPKPCMD